MSYYIQIVITTLKKIHTKGKTKTKYANMICSGCFYFYFFGLFFVFQLYFNEDVLLDNQGKIERKNNFNSLWQKLITKSICKILMLYVNMSKY